MREAASIASVDDISEELLVKVIRKVANLFLKTFGSEKAKCYLQSTEAEKIENLTNDHTQAYLLA